MSLIARLKQIHPAIWLWLTVFSLYLPTWHAGFVTDAIDWVHDAQTLPFRDYINRAHSAVHALYQTTQLLTLGVYKLFGTARIPWFLLFVTMQAGAAYLLYTLFSGIFRYANLTRPRYIAFWGAMIFCVSPYISEVLVWKACFHYLQGLILMLGILTSMQHFLHKKPQCGWGFCAGGLYLLSAFGLEMFYLTPLLTASLLLYYKRLGWFKEVLRRAWLFFFAPQIAILALHLFLFHLMYGEFGSHNTGPALAVPIRDHLFKGIQYAFHLLFFGRFWPQELKARVYSLCTQPYILITAYGLLIGVLGWLNWRSRRGYGVEQVAFMLLLWIVLGIGLAIPMPLETLFDLSGNRYLYLAAAFCSMLVALVAFSLRRIWLAGIVVGVWTCISVFLTLRTNRHWQTSERINESLLSGIPKAEGKTTILLSMPYCYKGIPMINAWPHGNFARMHDALLTPPLTGKVYDGMAFNMIDPASGSEVEVVNDSTVKVTLKQWGTWWWYKDFGGNSYETPDYKIDMRDQGHWYEIILKRPLKQYQLLYLDKGKWEVATR